MFFSLPGVNMLFRRPWHYFFAFRASVPSVPFVLTIGSVAKCRDVSKRYPWGHVFFISTTRHKILLKLFGDKAPLMRVLRLFIVHLKYTWRFQLGSFSISVVCLPARICRPFEIEFVYFYTVIIPRNLQRVMVFNDKHLLFH